MDELIGCLVTGAGIGRADAEKAASILLYFLIEEVSPGQVRMGVAPGAMGARRRLISTGALSPARAPFA
jgi:hypothetical protein